MEKRELLAEFHAAKKWMGMRPGFAFKLGAQGLGYYEELTAEKLKVRARRWLRAPAG